MDRSYDSTSQTASQPQVVDYNHGSISGKTSDDRSVASEHDRPVSLGRDVDLRDMPKEQDLPITSGRDVDLRGVSKDRDWPVTSRGDVDERGIRGGSASRNSPPPRHSPPPRDAEVDIKFIQDTIVSVCDFCSFWTQS